MKFFISMICIAAFCSTAQAVDKEQGEELHMAHCTGCHKSDIYTRNNRKVTSLPELGTRVRFCKDNLGLTWFDDEVNNVIHYLNTSYYKFK